MPRKPFAANFYSGASEEEIRRFVKDFEPLRLSTPVVAGLVPHAGWDYSGAVAAKVFRTIQSSRDPKTFIVFGTVHRSIGGNSVYARGSWLTPFGEIQIDEEFADRVVEGSGGLAQRDESAHDYEHSIEVQMPFLKHFFPDATVVPIAVLPERNAPALGAHVGKLIAESGGNAVVVGTTDLTHYGDAYMFTPGGRGPEALAWMRQNDARIIDLATELKAEDVVPEASKNMNACGAGAMSATIAAARTLGCTAAQTIEYTTSYDVMPEPEFRMAVGYVGMIFCSS